MWVQDGHSAGETVGTCWIQLSVEQDTPPREVATNERVNIIMTLLSSLLSSLGRTKWDSVDDVESETLMTKLTKLSEL